jgi:hypothetical protein
MAGNALIAASGVLGDFVSNVVDGELIVTFPVGLIDISLFTDLLNYILPAGMTYHIIRKTEWHRPYVDEFDYQEKLQAEWVQDLTFDDKTNTVSGLSSMFDTPTANLTFANFIGTTPNVGLLDNSIIPILETPLVNSEPADEPNGEEEQSSVFNDATDAHKIEDTTHSTTDTTGGN